MILQDNETTNYLGIEITRRGSSAVVKYADLNDFMYIVFESNPVTHFKSGGKNHIVFDYHSTFDFIIATEFKEGFYTIPDCFMSNGRLA